MENCASTSVYKRITLVLIACTLAVVCMKLYSNQSMFRMTYNVDQMNQQRLYMPGRDLNGHPRESAEHANNSDMFLNNTQKSIRLMRTFPEKLNPKNLMSIDPFHFLKNYKNPCWVANTTAPGIQCLPYYYLIGAPKCGTTDLHKRLIQHPDISSLAGKENHWLTRRRFEPHRWSGLAGYFKYYTAATREIYLNRNTSGYHSKIFGDGSASTMWLNDFWTLMPESRGLSEPIYTNADYIHHLNPNTKIIAMLRNPVDRSYSDFLYFKHGSPEMFHKGVVNAINETHDCLKSNSLRHCMYTRPRYMKVRLRIGVYHLHLKEFLRVFPREQVMVIKLEEFSQKTALYMEKIFAFLELPELGNNDLKRIANPEKHANPRHEEDRKTGKMLPETRKLLEEFYRPHNELLADLLGDKFNYNKNTIS